MSTPNCRCMLRPVSEVERRIGLNTITAMRVAAAGLANVLRGRVAHMMFTDVAFDRAAALATSLVRTGDWPIVRDLLDAELWGRSPAWIREWERVKRATEAMPLLKRLAGKHCRRQIGRHPALAMPYSRGPREWLESGSIVFYQNGERRQIPARTTRGVVSVLPPTNEWLWPHQRAANGG